LGFNSANAARVALRESSPVPPAGARFSSCAQRAGVLREQLGVPLGQRFPLQRRPHRRPDVRQAILEHKARRAPPQATGGFVFLHGAGEQNQRHVLGHALQQFERLQSAPRGQRVIGDDDAIAFLCQPGGKLLGGLHRVRAGVEARLFQFAQAQFGISGIVLHHQDTQRLRQRGRHFNQGQRGD
jgi:hypothetical protein